MADNPGNETLDNDNQVSPPSENPQGDIISSERIEEVAPNQETEKMEVHKHPHHVTHKKKWTEYLLEFFMLFLAVFLGFIAENIRENSAERHKEKEYIRSMIEDLKTDTVNINTIVLQFRTKVVGLDSLGQNLKEFINGSSPVFIRNHYHTRNFPNYVPTDRTLSQLKNAGGLRLISNMQASDSIMAYDANIKQILIGQNLLTEIHERLWVTWTEMVDMKAFDEFRRTGTTMSLSGVQNNFFLPHSEKENGVLSNSLYAFKNFCNYWQGLLQEQKNKDTRLMKFLREEYHLENE
jgi:hypothetical protein